MELKDLYDVSDEEMYGTLMRIMPPEIKQQVEEMFEHKFGLEQIENMLERGIKEVGIPKEIVDNLIRGLRWKYIQLIPLKD
jgi:phytoene/squalene synthetase